ncbi:unnamed protein product, partial [Gulo gulo]
SPVLGSVGRPLETRRSVPLFHSGGGGRTISPGISSLRSRTEERTQPPQPTSPQAPLPEPGSVLYLSLSTSASLLPAR